jgi:quercetin dioxygenase-like cupin family protein
MPFEESNVWRVGKQRSNFYADTLKDAAERPVRDAKRKKIIRPEEMPWEMAPQGLIKHLVNDQMNARAETVDIFMQIIPPGSRSGKRRQLAEECLYVLEGRGYDLHVDCDLDLSEGRYEWKPQTDVKRFEWEAGDMIYIPPNTISQHFNADLERPARLVSATNRIYKYSGLNDLEQIENAPEYDPGIVLDDETVLRYLGATASPIRPPTR